MRRLVILRLESGVPREQERDEGGDFCDAVSLGRVLT